MRRLQNFLDSWSVYWLSAACLILSIIAVGMVFLAAKIEGLTLVWGLTSSAAVLAPLGVKKLRLEKGKDGKGLEIAAVFLGGLAFYLVILFGTTLPMFLGYIGWAIGTAVYRTIQ